MQPNPQIMQTPMTVSVIELKRLLHEINDLRPDICIRMRLLGEMWHTSHMRVIKITDKGVVLNDEVLKR